MLVRITGFGSVWSVRMCRDENDSHRFARSAYYNTTGIVINGKLRRRWTSGGDVRFCGARSGFDPNYPDKAVGSPFDRKDRLESEDLSEYIPVGEHTLVAPVVPRG